MSRDEIFKQGNVAVVTGAALGIGRATGVKLAERGMSVVLADLPGDDFAEAQEVVRQASIQGADSVIGIPTDVSDEQAVDALRDAALQAFGQVDLLINNAATRIGRGFEADLADWRKLMDVNFWGPVHGVRAFLPSMLKSDGPGAIVNVGSKQGITNPPGHPVYNISKSAVKTYTEALEHDLRGDPENQGEARVSTHLLVPGWTTTGKAAHKPGAWLPERVVDMMIDAVSKDDFYIICPDDEVSAEMDRKRILWGAEDVTENRPPLSRWHPDHAEVAKVACS